VGGRPPEPRRPHEAGRCRCVGHGRVTLAVAAQAQTVKEGGNILVRRLIDSSRSDLDEYKQLNDAQSLWP
jgi:hypothetical protein